MNVYRILGAVVLYLMGWTAPAPGIDVPKWLSLNHH
jgi:hypothetical protein